MKRKTFLCAITILAILALSVGCQANDPEPNDPYSVGFIKAAESTDGYATVYVPSDREAKVLLLADPQLDPTQKYSIVGSYNELTLVFLNKFLDAAEPDLVIIAGDLTMTGLLNNWNYFCKIADIFETKKIPWSFVFGNHDCEKEYVSGLVEINSSSFQMTKPNLIKAVQEKYQYCLIYSGDCEDGYGNHVVNVRNTKGKLLNTFCNLDCTYDEDGYSHIITKMQTAYYAATIESLCEQEGRTIPSIVVTHVALPQTFIGYKEAKEGKEGSLYYYGELLEGDYSKYADQSPFFDTMLRLGSTKAVFFGHHHSNDASVEYRGIRLSFIPHSGMSHEYRTDHSKDYSMFGGWEKDTVFDFSMVDEYGDHRGGVMINVNQDATYTFSNLRAADAISDYSEWAVSYDAVAQKIAEDRGGQYVVRGKK